MPADANLERIAEQCEDRIRECYAIGGKPGPGYGSPDGRALTPLILSALEEAVTATEKTTKSYKAREEEVCRGALYGLAGQAYCTPAEGYRHPSGAWNPLWAISDTVRAVRERTEERDEARDQLASTTKDRDELWADRQKMLAQLATARDALEFYANENNHRQRDSQSRVKDDYGYRARRALKSQRGEEARCESFGVDLGLKPDKTVKVHATVRPGKTPEFRGFDAAPPERAPGTDEWLEERQAINRETRRLYYDQGAAAEREAVRAQCNRMGMDDAYPAASAQWIKGRRHAAAELYDFIAARAPGRDEGEE